LVINQIVPQQPSRHNVGAFLDFALAHASRGWSIIPVIGKKASGLWKPFQQERADDETLGRLFAKKCITGLAVITGKVSSGLAVRDFDKLDAYRSWANANPGDASTLPTVQTARGFHVYGRLGDETFTKYDDGELRADRGHYVLLSPSVHPDGSVYSWINQLPSIGVALPLLPFSLTHHAHHDTQDHSDNARQPSKHIACAHHKPLQEIIVRTLPNGPGRRNHCIFQLARALKALIPDAGPADLRTIVQEWHHQALPIIRTKDFSESWTDFVISWDRIKQPAGRLFRAAVETAESIALVGVGASYKGHLRRLAQLCAALQAQSGDSPFFLGCREAGEFLHIDKTQAWRLLKTLQFDGILQRVTKGTKTTRKASEWRFKEDYL
jgi:hypothetical protein